MTSSNRGEREAGIAQDRNKWSKVRTLPVSLSGNGATYTLHSQFPLFSQWMNFSHTLHFIVKEKFTSIYDNRSTIQKYDNVTTSIRLFKKFPVLYVKHKTTKHKLENSSLLGCDAASLGTWFPLFRRKVSLPSSRAQDPWTLEDESHSFQAQSVISQVTRALSYIVAKVPKLANTITFCVCVCHLTTQFIPQMFYPLSAGNFYQLMK